MTELDRQSLDEQGFLVLRGFMDNRFLQALRTRVQELMEQEGAEAGREFKKEPGAQRLANLVDKGELFEKVISFPAVLACVGHVLGPEFKLGSLNYRAAEPQEGGAQPLHVDMGMLPDDRGYSVCNTVWMLDAFTPLNGPLRCVPGSHKWRQRPQEALADPNAPHPQEIQVLGDAGDVVVMNAHLWHGGTTNHTDEARRCLHGFFVRRDLPQQQYQKQLLRPETQARLSPELRAILALDDSLNDELSSKFSQQSGFLK